MASEESTQELPLRKKQPKQQLSKAMEHMRAYVAISDTQPSATSVGEDAYGVPATYEPVRKPATNSKDNPEKRSDPFQFGTRYLEEGDDIFAHNAWDHVEVDPQYSEFIEQQTSFQRANQVSDFDKQRFNEKPEKWWDRFYGNNQANFFKDRKWLVQEFPVLGRVTQREYGPVTVLEVGAGAGNTAFPLLAMNANPALRLHACDYSRKAVEIIRSQPAYAAQVGGTAVLRADVWDVAAAPASDPAAGAAAADGADENDGDNRGDVKGNDPAAAAVTTGGDGDCYPPGLAPGSVDVILMIFVFSALSPDQWSQAVRNLHALLKPGGEVFFRDYGRGDLAQVRFKKGRYLDENFYVRGDGTRVYFFDEQELREIWTAAAAAAAAGEAATAGTVTNTTATTTTSGAVARSSSSSTATSTVPESAARSLEQPTPRGEGAVNDEASPPPHPALFEIRNLAVDRRMLVNRQRKLKMYRCWMQGRFAKPAS